MDSDLFIKNYLAPSTEVLDRSFTLPIPDIEGLRPCGEFIVQGHLDNTYSTNIITKYEADGGIRFVEVYKNTEDRVQEIFLRLVGTMSLVRKGYPFLILDAAVSNLNPMTGQKEGLSTRVALHLPQADNIQQKLFFEHLQQQAAGAGIACEVRQVQALPVFWCPFLSGRFEGIAFDHIATMRAMACSAYDDFCGRVQVKPDFDYRPAQEQIVFKNAQEEHHIFKKMGLAVAVEAQAAFFSMLVSGV